MHTQPEFYSLEFYSDANFWTAGDASTRRTFLMPLANPGEFLAFGVLRPANEVLFVARGRVIDHLGPFIARMKQAGATVELYARAPLPGHIIREYTKGDSHDQNEVDEPPPAPKAVGNVVLSGSPDSEQSFSGVSDLWAAVTTGISKRVVPLSIPDSTGQCLAFGLVKVEEYFERVAFVARLNTVDLGDSVANAPVSIQSVPEGLERYMNNTFSSLTAVSRPDADVASADIRESSVLIV